jgi:chromosome segregation ATPase
VPASDTDWVKELRERTHKLTSTCAALELNGERVQKELRELSEIVRKMSTADEIAKGVANELRQREQGERELLATHRARIDNSIRRAVWGIGAVLTLLQILGFVLK